MKAKAIRVAYGVTRNLGNYESLRLQYEVEVELCEDDTAQDAIDRSRVALRGMVDKGIKEEIAWDSTRS